MKISLIQMNSQNDKAVNLQKAANLIETAIKDENPQLVVLPDYSRFWTMPEMPCTRVPKYFRVAKPGPFSQQPQPGMA